MEAQSKIVYGKPRAAARIRRHWGGGIFFRELRAGFPSIAALAGLMGLFALMAVIREYLRIYYRSGYGLPGTLQLSDIWLVISLIAFLTMGVLSGAEEAENGTADFALRLPVTRMRIYIEKTLGALAAIGLWFVLAAALTDFILIVGLAHIENPYPVLIHPFGAIGPILVYGLLLFFCGQAAGAWTERVIVAAVVGGAVAVAVVFAAFAIHARITENTMKTMTKWHAAVFLTVGLIAMICAWVRFQTREGR